MLIVDCTSRARTRIAHNDNMHLFGKKTGKSFLGAIPEIWVSLQTDFRHSAQNDMGLFILAPGRLNRQSGR